MAITSRLAHRLRPAIFASPSRAFTSTTTRLADEKWPQTIPLGSYYDSILDKPSPYPFEEKPEGPPTSSNPEPPPPETKTPEPQAPESSPPPTKKKPGRKPKATASAVNPTPAGTPLASSPVPPTIPAALTAAEKARMVFGSPELKRQDEEARQVARASMSTTIAGVRIPPRPSEPDNCCMSGCVNCVWDLYRDEMEEWAAQSDEAKRRMEEKPKVGETKIVKDLWDENAFQNVPVGIREFMKLEKKLKTSEGKDI